jgi:hypothetical protein
LWGFKVDFVCFTRSQDLFVWQPLCPSIHQSSNQHSSYPFILTEWSLVFNTKVLGDWFFLAFLANWERLETSQETQKRYSRHF